MTPSTACHVAHHRGRSARVVLTLALAASCCVLLLPATAGAKVDKKYAQAFEGRVDGLIKGRTMLIKAYGQYLDELNNIGRQMEPLIGSLKPDDQALLAALQKDAKVEFKAGKSVMLRMVDSWEGMASDLGKKAGPWFSEPGDRLELGRGVRKCINGGEISKTALAHLMLGYRALGAAKIDEARSQAQQAATIVPAADEAQRAGLLKLIDLER